MMAYASGKYAQFICDTCGWAYPYKSAKMTWNGYKVCGECYEPKQPQIDPPVITADAEALWQPRPEVALPRAQLGVVTTTNPSSTVVDSTGSNAMTFTDDPIGSKFEGEEGTGEIGDLTVST
jgi:hypothetical protein